MEQFQIEIQQAVSSLRADPLDFLLMVALHFNAGWAQWTRMNKDNSLAIRGLFSTFHTTYWRTRFRAFYALQFFDFKLVKQELEMPVHSTLSQKTREIIASYVP